MAQVTPSKWSSLNSEAYVARVTQRTGTYPTLTDDVNAKEYESYYEVLEVPATATQSEVRRAYKDQGLKWHPDKWSTHAAEAIALAQERFRHASRAVEVLSDPAKRAQHDADIAAHEARSARASIMPLERAWGIFARIVIESAAAEVVSSSDRLTVILKRVASLGLPSIGFYFGASPGDYASQALCLLLVNPSGFFMVWDGMSAEQRREFSAAVFVLARAM